MRNNKAEQYWDEEVSETVACMGCVGRSDEDIAAISVMRMSRQEEAWLFFGDQQYLANSIFRCGCHLITNCGVTGTALRYLQLYSKSLSRPQSE